MNGLEKTALSIATLVLTQCTSAPKPSPAVPVLHVPASPEQTEAEKMPRSYEWLLATGQLPRNGRRCEFFITYIKDGVTTREPFTDAIAKGWTEGVIKLECTPELRP